jgi:hypothetical protein
VVEILAHMAETEFAAGGEYGKRCHRQELLCRRSTKTLGRIAAIVKKAPASKWVEQFRALREANLSLLRSLTPEQWKHHGIHEERGPQTIEQIVRMTAGHDINHTRQIQAILKPSTARVLARTH